MLLRFYPECFLLVSKICLIIDSIIGDKGRPHFNFKHLDRKTAKICSDTDAAQDYVKQTIELIDKLEANSTYAPILQKQSPNLLRFLKDSTNQQLFKTKCEDFFQGLKTARKADRDEQRTQVKLVRQIQKQFKDIKKMIDKQNYFAELDD